MMTSFLHFKHYLHSVQIVLFTPYHTTVFCIVATFLPTCIFSPFIAVFHNSPVSSAERRFKITHALI